ncbi:MAG: hypothetical protein IPP90_13635 [Gemmatimonadaceae bacterium]|nr:hypothetical protein [Gemmatimonadaceae bacterium]
MPSSPLHFFALCGCVWSLSACATMGTREPLISDRPDFTESPVTIEPRHVQVELGTTPRGPARTAICVRTPTVRGHAQRVAKMGRWA